MKIPAIGRNKGGGVWRGIDFREFIWRWGEGEGINDYRRMHLRNSRWVSAVVRIWPPFLNEESISTISSTVSRVPLPSSGSSGVIRPPVRLSVTVDPQEELPNTLHPIRSPELLE